MTPWSRASCATLLVCAACGGNDVYVGGLAEVTSMKAIPNRDLDILFVVDNSFSMVEEQTSLATNFPRMIDVLETLDDGLPNLHIGVVTSDMGSSGSSGAPAPNVAGCFTNGGDNGRLVQSPAVSGRFISDIAIDGGREVNYTGQLRDAFSSIALVGDMGCGIEQHLRAMKQALVDQTTNAGFLRPEANLAIVIVADEDDSSVKDTAVLGGDAATLGPLGFRGFRFGVQCDPDDPMDPGPKSDCAPRAGSQYIEDVAQLAQFLLDVKGDERKVMVSAVVGDPSPVEVVLSQNGLLDLAPSCTYSGPNGEQNAFPAVRLAAFLDEFPDRSTLTSICNPDLSGAMDRIGESAKKLMGDPCIDTNNLADTSAAAGVQPACEVIDVRDSDPNPVSLPACGTTDGDCFELVADPNACPSSSDHLRVRIHRTAPVSDDTWTHVRCQPA